MVETELRQLLSGNELVILEVAALRLLHLLRQVVQEGAPAWSLTQLRNEVGHHLGLLAGNHDQTTVRNVSDVVDVGRRLDVYQGFVGLRITPAPKAYLVVVKLDGLLVGRKDEVLHELDAGDGCLILVREGLVGGGASEVVQLDHTLLAAKSEAHAIRTIAQVADVLVKHLKSERSPERHACRLDTLWRVRGSQHSRMPFSLPKA